MINSSFSPDSTLIKYFDVDLSVRERETIPREKMQRKEASLFQTAARGSRSISCNMFVSSGDRATAWKRG